jgi:DNA-binding MarR family transcriptional regulator
MISPCAIAAGADTASALARRLAVSKQAAAKTIAVLEERGYVARGEDPHDARRRPLEVTALGLKMLREGESVFEELRERWARLIGPKALRTLEKQLAVMVGRSAAQLEDMPDELARRG